MKRLTIGASVLILLLTGCSSVSVEQGQDQFRIVMCSLAQSRADIRSTLDLGEPADLDAAYLNLADSLDVAASDFTDPQVEWPSNVDLDDLAILAEQFQLESQVFRELSTTGTLSQEVEGVSNEVKMAKNRIERELSIDQVEDECSIVE